MFRVTGMKILARVGTHFFFWKKNNFMHFERQNFLRILEGIIVASLFNV